MDSLKRGIPLYREDAAAARWEPSKQRTSTAIHRSLSRYGQPMQNRGNQPPRRVYSNQAGWLAHGKRAGLIGESGHRCRVGGEQPQSLFQWRAGEPDKIRKGAVQREHAAGQYAISPWPSRSRPAPRSRPVDTRRRACRWRSWRRLRGWLAAAPWPATTASRSPGRCGCRRRSARQTGNRWSAPCPECPVRADPARAWH